MKTIAITGTAGFVGGMLCKALTAPALRYRVIAIDRIPPPCVRARCHFERLDLTNPKAAQQLTECLRDHRCVTVVHAALPTRPLKPAETTHELQSIGTMYLLYAAERAHVRRLLLASTTDLYGAFPTNPNFLTEGHPLRGGELSAFLHDKVDVERQCARFQQKHPKAVVTVLRPCTIVGPTIHNYKTHYLQHPIIPSVLGYDPLVQFVHESDIVRAFCLAIERPVAGAFNIVGHGVMPLSRALAMAQRIRVPVAGPLLYAIGRLLWQLDLSAVPAMHLNFLKYPCVADGERARRGLGFTAVYSTQEALLSFIQTQIPHEGHRYEPAARSATRLVSPS